MGILSGFLKTKKYRKTSDGYKLQSEWTSSETVQYNNGLTLEESEVYLTQAEYNALGDSKYTNNIKYYITDAGITGDAPATKISYNNASSGLAATNVQTAVDELNSKLEKEYLEFAPSEIFPNIASRVYVENGKLYIMLGGYSSQYLKANNYYKVGKIENVPLLDNVFINGCIANDVGQGLLPISVAIYGNGDVTMFTHGITVTENKYNVLNVTSVIPFQ